MRLWLFPKNLHSIAKTRKQNKFGKGKFNYVLIVFKSFVCFCSCNFYLIKTALTFFNNFYHNLNYYSSLKMDEKTPLLLLPAWYSHCLWQGPQQRHSCMMAHRTPEGWHKVECRPRMRTPCQVNGLLSDTGL